MKWSREAQFFIENYDDIAALVHLEERARRKMPSEVRSHIRAVIAQDISTWPGFENHVVVDDEEQVWWSSLAFYDERKDVGPYFGIFPLTAEGILEPDSNLRPLIFLGVAGEKASRPALQKQTELTQRVVKRARGSCKAEGLHFTTYDAAEKYVYAYWKLDDLMGHDAIADRDSFVGSIVERAKSFSTVFSSEMIKLV